jgi:hypothetical protein
VTKLPIYNSAVSKDMREKVADLQLHFSEKNISDKASSLYNLINFA